MENEVKEPAPKYNFISQDEYLAAERLSDTKHEYYNGEVYAMAGASPEHNDIAYNVSRIIAPFLHGKGCKIYNSDFRIHIPENSLFTYPNFSIVCGNTETSEVYTDNLTNPVVIIEILSPSSKDYDRGTKFTLYRNIKTLKEYVLIESESAFVEIYTRVNHFTWTLTEHSALSDYFFIESINLKTYLRDLYEDVNLKND